MMSSNENFDPVGEAVKNGYGFYNSSDTTSYADDQSICNVEEAEKYAQFCNQAQTG